MQDCRTNSFLMRRITSRARIKGRTLYITNYIFGSSLIRYLLGYLSHQCHIQCLALFASCTFLISQGKSTKPHAPEGASNTSWFDGSSSSSGCVGGQDSRATSGERNTRTQNRQGQGQGQGLGWLAFASCQGLRRLEKWKYLLVKK